MINRNFNALRNLHEQYFRRPRNYSVSRIRAPAQNQNQAEGNNNQNNQNDGDDPNW